jgi:hypothetical protein
MAAAGNALKAAVLLASAVLVEPCRAALDGAAFDAEQRRILEQVEQIQARDGPYAPALLEELKQLIMLYRENDSPSLALVTIERALQVVRANSGLYSLEQVPLLWQQLESEEALDNHAGAWNVEQELLALVRRYPGDVQVVPVLRRVADRQMRALGQLAAAGEIPPQVFYGCYYDKYRPSGTKCSGSGSRATVLQGMLADAGRNYADAIAVLLRNGAYSSDELRELEMQVVRGAGLMRDTPLAPPWLFASTLEPWRSRIAPIEELATWQLPSEPAGTSAGDYLDRPEPREDRFRMPYNRGRQSLRRLYSYELAGSSAAASRAAAIVAIADWDLLFSKNALAIEGYALAQRLLDEEGAGDAATTELFAPAVPVVLPSFEPNPLAPDDAHAAAGYIDVTFSITKYGHVRDIKVRGAVNAGSADRTELMTLLRMRRLRPRSVDGRFTDSPVAVRYYVYDRHGAT